MSLQDLEKDLQRRESVVAKREHEHTQYDVWGPHVDPAKEQSETSTWEKIKDRMQETRVKAIVYGGIMIFTLVFILGILAVFLYFQKGFFDQDRVVLTMEASANINSNKLTEIVFSYKNDNRATLHNAEIIVYFGKYFIPEENQDHFTRISDGQGTISLGDIAGHESRTITLAGHFAGPQGAVDDVAGTLRYVPERTTARFETSARTTTMITSSSVKIDVQAPLEIVSGNLMDIGFIIQNTSGDILEDLSFSVDTPKAFSFFNATPSPNHSTVWLIDAIPAHGEMIIHMRGGLSGDVGTVQTFNASVRTQGGGEKPVEYARNTYTPRMTRSPIIVQQKHDLIEGVAYAGERIAYHIYYKNDSSIALRDAIIVMKLDGHVLDLTTLDLSKGGDYDEQNKTITWKASDVPSLKRIPPGGEGDVVFAVTVRTQLPVENEKDFHYSIATVASIDSEDIPSELRENKTVLSNILTVPVGAKVMLTPAFVHKSGPKPMRVGQETQYEMTLTLGSVNNDLADTKVVISLPTHIVYKGSSSKNVAFNERTNELTWNIGTVVHGSGIVRDAYAMSYDFSIIPSIDQKKTVPSVINGYVFTGVDAFTKKNLMIQEGAIVAGQGELNQEEYMILE